MNSHHLDLISLGNLCNNVVKNFKTGPLAGHIMKMTHICLARLINCPLQWITMIMQLTFDKGSRNKLIKVEELCFTQKCWTLYWVSRSQGDRKFWHWLV